MFCLRSFFPFPFPFQRIPAKTNFKNSTSRHFIYFSLIFFLQLTTDISRFVSICIFEKFPRELFPEKAFLLDFSPATKTMKLKRWRETKWFCEQVAMATGGGPKLNVFLFSFRLPFSNLAESNRMLKECLLKTWWIEGRRAGKNCRNFKGYRKMMTRITKFR